LITEDCIKKLASEWLTGSDKFLVALKIKTGNRILIFIDGDHGVSIEECVKLSRHIESNLDRDKDDFELQVSSAGADQPLIMPRQYKKHIGRQMRITTTDNLQIIGMLEHCTDDGVTIKIAGDKKKKEPEKTLDIAFCDIRESKIEISFKK
jgi:ribosome maturation factor RimP